jgi:hypothetical protein
MAQSVKFRSSVESPFDERRTFFLAEMATHRQRGATCGVEAQIFKNAELLVGNRHQTRALAVQWAEHQRQDIEKGGE